MANCVINKIYLSGEEKDIQKIIETYREKDEFGRDYFDFEKIVSMPKSLNIEIGYLNFIMYLFAAINRLDFFSDEEFFVKTAILAEEKIRKLGHDPNSRKSLKALARFESNRRNEDILKLGEEAYFNYKNFGYCGCHDWRMKNWGVKGNSANTIFENETIEFETVWNFPEPIARKFAEKHPEIEFTWKWAEGERGINTGTAYNYKDEGFVIEEVQDHSSRAYEIYAELWCEE